MAGAKSPDGERGAPELMPKDATAKPKSHTSAGDLDYPQRALPERVAALARHARGRYPLGCALDSTAWGRHEHVPGTSRAHDALAVAQWRGAPSRSGRGVPLGAPRLASRVCGLGSVRALRHQDGPSWRRASPRVPSGTREQTRSGSRAPSRGTRCGRTFTSRADLPPAAVARGAAPTSPTRNGTWARLERKMVAPVRACPRARRWSCRPSPPD
jgi:hypothetical protein